VSAFARIGIFAAVVLVGGDLALGTFTGGTFADPFCGGDAFRCTGGDCKATVSNVTCGPPGPGNYGHMDVTPPVFSVCKRARMVWSIDDHALAFPADGIALKSPNSDFDPSDADHKDWKFTWLNKHNNLRPIDYAVTVQKGGTNCAHLDPRISNE
jgi:hypothetical protein